MSLLDQPHWRIAIDMWMRHKQQHQLGNDWSCPYCETPGRLT